MQRSAMRRCLKGLGGFPTSNLTVHSRPVTRHSGSASLFFRRNLLTRFSSFTLLELPASDWHERFDFEMEALLPRNVRADALPAANARRADASADQRAAESDGKSGRAGAGARSGFAGADLASQPLVSRRNIPLSLRFSSITFSVGPGLYFSRSP